MGRKAEPGISYYRMNCGHTMNKKVRLLVHDYKGIGYWIWQCLLDSAFSNKGYYFDCAVKDELEIFATDVCKESLELIEKVIDCCLRRGLFDKRLYDEHLILTSERMQEIYLDATLERRRKGTEVELQEEYVLVGIPENSRNISIVPRIKPILPRNNSNVPVNNPHSRVKESKEEKSKVNPTGGAPAKPSPPEKDLKKKKQEEETEPYWDKLVKVWFDFGIEKFGVEPSFERDDPKIFKRIIGRLKTRAEKQGVVWSEKSGPQRLRHFLDSAYGDDWLAKNFLLSNLEKQFDKVIQNQTDAAKKTVKANASDLQYLYERFLEGQLTPTLLTADHYDQLSAKKIVEAMYWQQMVQKRVRNLTGTNQAPELRLLAAYQEGKDSDERRADVSVLKRLAVLEVFSLMKGQNIKQIPDAVVA